MKECNKREKERDKIRDKKRAGKRDGEGKDKRGSDLTGKG